MKKISSSMKAIFCREVRSYLSSPLGYIFVSVFLFSLGYVTFEPGRGSFFLLRQASLSAFFHYVPWLSLFLVPALSMRLWAEERKSGTIELLLTLPVTTTEAVLGKFFAAWAFMGIVLLGTFPMPLTVIYLGRPDYGAMILGYLSAFLMIGGLLSIGSFFSILTKNQVVSFILTVASCYVFIMAGAPPILETLSQFLPRYFLDLFESLSVLNHFESMAKGVLTLGDLCFFGILIGGWIYASVILLNEKKAS